MHRYGSPGYKTFFLNVDEARYVITKLSSETLLFSSLCQDYGFVRYIGYRLANGNTQCLKVFVDNSPYNDLERLQYCPVIVEAKITKLWEFTGSIYE